MWEHKTVKLMPNDAGPIDEGQIQAQLELHQEKDWEISTHSINSRDVHFLIFKRPKQQ